MRTRSYRNRKVGIGGGRGWGIGPTEDLLGGSATAGAGSETHKCGRGSYGGRNIDQPREAERFTRDCGVRDAHSQSSTIVTQVRLKDIATVQVDAAAQSSGRYRWRSPVYI